MSINPASMPRPRALFDETGSLVVPFYGPRILLALRGLPASGKSTWAKAAVAADPGRVVRVNNDELANMVLGGDVRDVEGVGDLVAAARKALVTALLSSQLTRVVIVDNTNLSAAALTELEVIAGAKHAHLVVDERFLSVDFDECVRRNAARAVPVPFDQMERMRALADQLPSYTAYRQGRFGPVGPRPGITGPRTSPPATGPRPGRGSSRASSALIRA